MLMVTVHYETNVLKKSNTVTGTAHPFIASVSLKSDTEDVVGPARSKTSPNLPS